MSYKPNTGSEVADYLISQFANRKPVSTLQYWSDWLTDDRLGRWNHIRERGNQEPLTREIGASFLLKLEHDPKSRETLQEIKDRIA